MEIPALSFPEEEANVLREYYKTASSILEYGSGGSTWYAAIHSGKKIVTVESDYEFGNALLRKLNAAGLPSIPNIIYEDIGPVGKWGRPIDPSHWNKFIHYALAPWKRFPDLEPDVVLIDGRFRTACFAATVLSIKRSTIILFDDYVGRPHYHKVEFLAKPDNVIGRLAVFYLTPQQYSNNQIKEIFGLLFNASATAELEDLKTRTETVAQENKLLAEENAYLKKELEGLEERLEEVIEEKKLTYKQHSILKKDLRRARKKYRKLKRWGLVLSMPSLIALSPVSIPVGIFYSIKQWRRRLKKKNKPVSNALLAPKASEAASAPKHLVFDAFLLHQNSSPTAALALLDKHKENVPAGTRALFESMNAKTDSDWLDAINRWASARGLPEILLKSGTKPRFYRIAFSACEEVDAPHLVTVIMPCYNAEDTVERSVRSILGQTWKNIELIAVNDASTDATGSILEEIAKSESRLKVLHNRINAGPYLSKNLALMQAKGQYVTGHDADDIALPNRISMQMGPILVDPECKATIGHMIRLDEHGCADHLSKNSSNSHDGIFRKAFISLLIERDLLLESIGFWDNVRFGADSEMFARVKKHVGQNLKLIENALMLCLSSEKSLTGNSRHGISHTNELSPTRKSYIESWQDWHKKTDTPQLSLPFILGKRSFQAPKAMLVPEDTIWHLLEPAISNSEGHHSNASNHGKYVELARLEVWRKKQAELKRKRDYRKGLMVSRDICRSRYARPEDCLRRTEFMQLLGQQEVIHRYVYWLQQHPDIPQVERAMRLYVSMQPSSALRALGSSENWDANPQSAQVAYLSLLRLRKLQSAGNFLTSSKHLQPKPSGSWSLQKALKTLNAFGIKLTDGQDVAYVLLDHWLQLAQTNPPDAYDSEKGRVMIYSHSLSIGGAERQVAHLIKGLVEDSAVTSLELLLKEHSRISYDLGVRSEKFRLHNIAHLPEKIRAPWGNHKIYIQIKELCKQAGLNFLYPLLSAIYELRPEVLHVRGGLHAEVALAGILAGVPRIVVQFGSMTRGQQSFGSELELQREQLVEHIIRQAAVWQQVVLAANSRAAADDWARACELPKERLIVMHNAIEEQELGFMPPPPFDGTINRPLVVGGVFRFAPVKDPLLWVEVASKVHEARPGTRFLMVGDGPMRAAVEKAIVAVGLEEQFELPGLITTGLFSYLRRMNLFLMTTRTESLPNAVIEAQLAGLPVVAPDVGGISEAAASPDMVRLTATRDKDALAEAVIRSIDDVAWRKEVYTHAPDLIRQKFSRSAFVDAAKKAYGWSDR